MQGNPKPGEIYRHFKNQYYQVIAIAHHSEREEKLVVYQALYGDFGVCARPYPMFISEVDRQKYPDVKQKYRFEYVGLSGEIGVPEGEHIQKTENIKNMNNTENTGKTDKLDKLGKSEKIGDIIGRIEEIEKAEEEKKKEAQEESDSQQGNANKKLIEFLDAQSYREKRNVLVSMKKELSDDLINAMAASMDIIVEDGPIDRRYRSLLNCIETNMKFETNRFR